MKCKILFLKFSFLLFSAAIFAQDNVGIGTLTPHPSAKLDITSTNKGLLIPRMDSSQRVTIPLPAVGLIVFQTNATPGFYYYNGAFWTILNTSQLEKITEAGNSGFRILGRNPINYGDIGLSAIDLSFSTSTSSTKGATGNYSTALGYQTTASGFFSSVLGNLNTASGTSSTAMGSGSIASGNYSTTLGVNTSASGTSSLAMGSGSIASGSTSSAMGTNTIASGENSTATGSGTSAQGSNSLTSGNGTVAKSYGETVIGSYNDTLLITNASSFANDSNRVFTVGKGTMTNRNNALIIQQNGNIGINKRIAEEKLDINGSIKMVDGLQGSGKVLTSDANGKARWHPLPPDTPSELEKITEIGNTGYRLLGVNPDNYGNIGNHAVDLSISTGPSTTRGAKGNYSVTLGLNTSSEGFYATSMGFETKAMGVGATSFGNITTANASASTSMGSNTIADGISSTAMGYYTVANGDYSTSMGSGTNAKERNSVAMGKNTIAISDGELVIGRYNDTITWHDPMLPASDTDRAFTVGAGNNFGVRRNVFVIEYGGRVGIGNNVSKPLSKAILEIDNLSNSSYDLGSYGVYNSSGSGSTSSEPSTYSIWASRDVAASEFHAFSDMRIKNKIDLSNGYNDLNTLSKIRITDYTMRDKVHYGDKQFKKVIAQELKEVYPAAVGQSINIIPDIYKNASAQQGWIVLDTDLQKGDKVKIITANGAKEVIVEEIANGKFKVAIADGQVFVYGKEVKDFHTVDYEALTTLNISATQELLKRIEKLEAELNELIKIKVDIENLKSKMNSFVKASNQ